MKLKVEYLPSICANMENVCVCTGGDSLVRGVILTAQVKLDAAATCNFISYVLQDA
jgi:hypothetical protein